MMPLAVRRHRRARPHRGRRARRREPGARALPAGAARRAAARDRVGGARRPARRRGHVRLADPRVDDAAARPARRARARPRAVRRDPAGTPGDRRHASASPMRTRRWPPTQPPGDNIADLARHARRPRERADRARHAGGARLLRPAAAGGVRGAPGRGLPRGRHGVRLLLGALGRRRPPGHLLRERLRPADPAAAHHGERHVPRGGARPSLPARDRTGDARPPGPAPVRRHPGRQRVLRRLGALRRAPRRRDGPVPRRLGTPRHGRRPDPPGRPPRDRHRPARARLDPRAGDRQARGRRRTPHRRRDRGRPLHRRAGAGALVHDRHDRDRARPSGGRAAMPGFALRDFHDRVLGLGQLPLPAFRREMGLGGGPERTGTLSRAARAVEEPDRKEAPPWMSTSGSARRSRWR